MRQQRFMYIEYSTSYTSARFDKNKLDVLRSLRRNLDNLMTPGDIDFKVSMPCS